MVRYSWAPGDCAHMISRSRRALLLLVSLATSLVALFFVYPSLISVSSKKEIRNEAFHLINYQFGEFQFPEIEIHNETGFDMLLVPDIVHYIQLENPYLEFVTLISIMSVVKHHKPKLVLIHTDRGILEGKYWDKVLELNASHPDTIIKLNRIKRPNYIFGKKLSSVYHASDIARMAILATYGGIYLDADVYVVKPLHRFRKFEFALGWPENQYLGTQVLICHRNARFLRLWHESYREYKPTLWYYNAGELPTTRFLAKRPDLVHRVKTEFGVHYLLPMLYSERYPYWQKEYDAIHLLARHRSHSDGIQYFDEDNIRDYNRTFGEMARLAYYDSKDIL